MAGLPEGWAVKGEDEEFLPTPNDTTAEAPEAPEVEDELEEEIPEEETSEEETPEEETPEEETEDETPEEDNLEEDEPEEEAPEEEVPTVDDPEEEWEEVDYVEVTNGVFDNEEDMKKAFEDPYLKNAIEYFLKEGTLAPYAEAMRHDYDAMSPEDLLRIEHAAEYAGEDLTSEELNELFEDEVLSKYVTENDEGVREVRRINQIKMKKESNKIRAKLKEEQKTFASPTTREEKKVDNEQRELAQRKKEASYRSQIKKSLSNGAIAINTSTGDFSLSTDENKLVELVMDPRKLLSKFVGEDGQVNMGLVAAINNIDEFVASVANKSETQGKKAIVDQKLKNKPKRTGGKSKGSATSFSGMSTSEAMKKDPKGFLKGIKVVSGN